MGLQTVLVTGAAGFIGSVVTDLFVREGYRVVATDNLSKGHRAAVHPDAEFIEADLRDYDALMRIFSGRNIDAALHLGAEALVDESIFNPSIFFQVNVTGGLHLLDAMAHGGCKNLIFSSTAAVYGDPVSMPIKEDDQKSPVNAYGESKLAFERVLPWYARAYGLRHVSFRYFNACGATEKLGEDRAKETHLIPVAFEAADGRRPSLSLFGTDWDTPDGTCIRDYLHVEDIAMAHLLGLRQIEERTGNAYNLGSGNGFTNKQVIETVKQVTGADFEVVPSPRRAGDPERLVASADKAHAQLGWSPRHTTVQTMVESAWAWRKAHPKGYEE